MIVAKLIAIQIMMGSVFYTSSKPKEEKDFPGAIPIITYSFEEKDDLDYDSFPDRWLKRKGTDFPNYNNISIDREFGSNNSRQSLRFDLKRDQIAAYSPIKKIDAPHSYLLTGKIKTQSLVNSAAVISISFLDSERVRILRKHSDFYTGSFREWHDVIIPPVHPPENAKYAVIGCHLAQGKKKDIKGTVWFDELQLKQLPRLTINSNFETHFIKPHAPIVIEWNIRGLDPGNHNSSKVINEDKTEKEPTKNKYELHLEMFDHSNGLDNSNKPIEEKTVQLQPDVVYKDGETVSQYIEANHKPWKLAAKEHGFYTVKATLKNHKDIVFSKKTSFTVLDFISKPQIKNGDFGWSILTPLSSNMNNSLGYSEMENIIKQGGLQWLQYPVWHSVTSVEKSQKLSEFFEKISHQRVKTVGVLNDPPYDIRKKFARDWNGVSEVFSMKPKFWKSSVEAAVARNSTSIRHWQLGNNRDQSFFGLNSFEETMDSIQSEFSKIGRDTRLGFAWKWEENYPKQIKNSKTFLILESAYPDDHKDVYNKTIKRKAESSGEKIWVLIKPMSEKEADTKLIFEEEISSGNFTKDDIAKKFEEQLESPKIIHSDKQIRDERSSDLVKRMIAAKHANADVIIAYDIFDSKHGLLNENGSPGILFLPWRTTSLQLSGARLAGNFRLKDKSENLVFFRQKEVEVNNKLETIEEAVVIVWNEESTVNEPTIENIFLGEKAETSKKFWEQEDRISYKNPNDQFSPLEIKVTPEPLIIQNCSPELARWRMAVKFKKGQVPSKSSELYDEITGINPYNYPLNCKILKVVSQSGWKISFPEKNDFLVEPSAPFSIPINIKLGSETSIGDEELEIHFQITTNQQSLSLVSNQKQTVDNEHYEFIVHRTYKVGSNDISLLVNEKKLDNGVLQVKVTVNTKKPMDFTCRLFRPNQAPLKGKLLRVRPTKSLTFNLPKADSIRGQRFSVKITQIRGDHVLNHKWTVGENWDEDAKKSKREAQRKNIKELREALKQKQIYRQAKINKPILKSAQLPINRNRR